MTINTSIALVIYLPLSQSLKPQHNEESVAPLTQEEGHIFEQHNHNSPKWLIQTFLSRSTLIHFNLIASLECPNYSLLLTWNNLIDIGTPFSNICPRVGPCARRDMTSNNARFPLPIKWIFFKFIQSFFYKTTENWVVRFLFIFTLFFL